MYLPSVVQKQPQINTAVSQIVNELEPSVVQIQYEIGQDWSGAWAIFFRVILSDEASTSRNLRDITTQVVSRMSDQLDLPTLGLFPYFSFRSQSEHARVGEPAWA